MAKKNYSQGIYNVINKDKYIGNKEPTYRSGWENRVMIMLDTNQHILRWGSEVLRIPYRNPLTGKNTTYLPDFLINYLDKTNTLRAELLEIKPYGQTILTEKTSQYDKMAIIVNHAKWQQARIFCKQYGLHFRVLTERELFWQGKKH
jgi:hypothetical protein